MATAKVSAEKKEEKFRPYASMTDGEKAAFRQGATTVKNSVNEKLGLKKVKV